MESHPETRLGGCGIMLRDENQFVAGRPVSASSPVRRSSHSHRAMA